MVSVTFLGRGFLERSDPWEIQPQVPQKQHEHRLLTSPERLHPSPFPDDLTLTEFPELDGLWELG